MIDVTKPVLVDATFEFSNNSGSLKSAISRYATHLAVKGYTPIGRNSAERYLNEFAAWAADRGVTNCLQADRFLLERYQDWLNKYRKKNGEPLASNSQRSKIIPLRSFFKWLVRGGAIASNPTADLDLPRQIKHLPSGALTASEAERVLSSVDPSTALGLRDRAMLEVLYATGIRRMELAGLKLEDIDFERTTVFIRQGKGQKDRVLPLGHRALDWVRRYLRDSRMKFARSLRERSLFVSPQGS